MAYKKLKYWFDKALAERLADKIEASQAIPSFDRKAFITEIDQSVQGLELKDRVEQIADTLLVFIGPSFEEAVSIIPLIVGPENKNETGMFTEFYWLMPFAKMVEKYGLKHFEASMKALAMITKRNTSEYAVRPFLVSYPDKTIKQMMEWSRDNHFHLRRLSCEGARPRLPWAPKLQQFIDDPSPLLPILENLKSDPIRYVQKSVANCINDILKDHPEVAKPLVESWNKESSKDTQWIIKHSLRNLLKKDDPWAITIINS